MVSLTVITTAAKARKTPRKQKVRLIHTFPATFMIELKQTIAIESVSQFLSTDMSISYQNDKAGLYFHGPGSIMSRISICLQGADKYENIWVNEDTPEGAVIVIPESLHHQVNKVLITGRNITPPLLERTYATNAGRVSGRIIKSWAFACVCEAKKC